MLRCRPRFLKKIRPRLWRRFSRFSIRCASWAWTINPESRVKVQVGPAQKSLVEQGWRIFLVKVHNEAGVTAPLRCSSPNAEPLHDSKSDAEPPQHDQPARRGSAVARHRHESRAAAGRAAVRPCARILRRRAIQPRPRTARGQAGVRRGARHAGLGLSQRSQCAVRLRAVRRA